MLTFVSICVCAQKTYDIQSPDGKLKVVVSVGNNITYTLSHEATEVLSSTPVSMTLESGEVLGKSPKGAKAKKSGVNRVVASPFYSKAEVKEHYNELVLSFSGGYGLIFRAYDDGMVYRFVTNRKDKLTITSEEFGLNFPHDHKAFVSYVLDKKPTLEEQMFNSFENGYVCEQITKLDNERLIFLPLLVDLGNGKKLCVTEVDLWGYPGSFMNNSTQKSSFSALQARYPSKTEPRNNSYFPLERHNYIAKTSGKRDFPWRVMIVAEDDAALLNSDMVYKVAEPSRIADQSWIKPGKAIWDWWHATALTGVDFRSGMNTETFKHYVDFAAKNGLEYVLVDAGWAIDPDNILAGVRQGMNFKELVSYGKQKGVDILAWMSYRAFHHDMDNVAKHFSDLGIKGFKIDFQDRDDQEIADFIYNAAAICAKYHLVVDFHGIHKPTGLQRTWPNIINYEGVMGLEWVKFGDVNTLDLVTYDVTMPFIRMKAGPIDYTPGAMRNASKENFRIIRSEPMSQGTRCRQLAAYIVFEAPLAMISDRPSVYEKEKECMDFIAGIPTVWEQSVPLENKVSEYVSIARKKNNDWYIGAMTNWDARELTLDLSFLDEGEYKAEIFYDGVNASRIASDYKKEIVTVPVNRKLLVKMAPGGGFVARISK